MNVKWLAVVRGDGFVGHLLIVDQLVLARTVTRPLV